MTGQGQVSFWIVVIFILLLPTRSANGGGKDFSGRWETTNDVMTWNKPPIPGFDIRFTSGKSALAIPFELDGHRILVRVSVNDSPPLSFLLDTGVGHIILGLQHAKSFGMRLQPAGKTSTTLPAAEQQNVYLVTDKASFSLPGVVFSSQILVAISLDKHQECTDQLTHGGRDQNTSSDQTVKEGMRRVVDGYLGTGFFSSFVVEMDYPARLINLYDPQGYKYTGRGKSIPLEMSSEKLKAATACMVGNRLEMWAGTLEALQLDDFKVSNPLTIFSQLSDDQDYDGFLGGLALRNFQVIFDYSRSRMILESPGPVKSSK